MVQAGSLLQANGGYLIMEVESILMDQFAWESLKRACKTSSSKLRMCPGAWALPMPR